MSSSPFSPRRWQCMTWGWHRQKEGKGYSSIDIGIGIGMGMGVIVIGGKRDLDGTVEFQ